MRNFNLTVVEDGQSVCLGDDVKSIKIDDTALTYVCEDGACEDVYPLDRAETVIVQIGR